MTKHLKLTTFLLITFLIGCPNVLNKDAEIAEKKEKITKSPDAKSVKGSDELWFDDTKHHKIEIEMEQTIYDQMAKEHYDDSTEYRIMTSFKFDGVSMPNAAIKCRGGTTANKDNSNGPNNKKSYKIQFDCTDPLNTADAAIKNKRASHPDYDGRKFYGEKEINIRTSPNDPSVIRELISYKVYRENGVPAPRASTATLYINGKARGVYLIVEEIDKRLLKQNFSNPEGNLYKCGWTSGDGANFKSNSYNIGRYKLQTNKTLNNVSDIKKFLTNLNNVNNKEQLSAIVNLNNIVSFMAISSLIGHWDSLFANFNNDFVYNDPASNKWHVIAWDCDNVFGSDWMDDTLNLPYNQGSNDSNRTANFCNKVNQYADSELKDKLRYLINQYKGTNKLENEIDRLINLIKEEVKTDPFLENYDAFIAGITSKPTANAFKSGKLGQYKHDIGIKGYFQQRITKIESGL